MTVKTGARLGFAWGWDQGEDNWNTGSDKNWRENDALIGAAVTSDALTAPPSSPADGDQYIVGASPSGAWTGHATHIAAWQAGSWYFYPPALGLRVWVANLSKFRWWNGTAWTDEPAGSGGGSGTVTSIVVKGPMTGGTITNSGTIGLPDMGPATIIGNAGTGTAAPSVLALGSGFTAGSGTIDTKWHATNVSGLDSTLSIDTDGNLGLHTQAAKTLVGNYGTITGQPGPIAIGTGLSLTSTGTLNSTGTASATLTVGAHSIVGNPGTVSAASQDIAIGTGLTLTSTGTLNVNGGYATTSYVDTAVATKGTGTVTGVVAGAGLAGGTITNSGTISLGTTAPGSLVGNPGTAAAVPVPVAIGAGLTLSTAGTLSGLWNAGLVTSLDARGPFLNGNTISSQQRSTITATATGTINAAAGDSCLVNVGTVNTVLTVGTGTPGQRLRLDIVQGATAHTVGFDSTVQFGADVTSYTAGTVAAKTDHIVLINNSGTVWDFVGASHGF